MKSVVQPCPSSFSRSNPLALPSAGFERHEETSPIYAGLAPHYDRLVGDALFPAIRDSFEWCRRRLGLRFRTVADIGCGTGRFLAHMRRYRVPMIGVDGSGAALRLAARRLHNAHVLWLRQDIRRLQLPRPVDLITCNGDTLNYLLRPEELRATLRRCRDQLNPGGLLLGDFLSGIPAPSIGGQPARQCIRLPGMNSYWEWRTLPARRMTRVKIRFIGRQNGRLRQSQEVHWQRWHQWSELRELLEKSGFGGCEAWNMPAPGGAGLAGRWLKFVARR